jgi:transcriptional regulator with XRE-family HTH domain
LANNGSNGLESKIPPVTSLADEPKYDLADYIRKLRSERDETQDEFAKGVGIGSSTLRNIETRVVERPDLDTLRKIALYTNRALATFVGYLQEPAEADTHTVATFPSAVPGGERGRRKEDAMSSQAWEIAQQYDRLPPLAQTAIDAIIRAFKQR